MGDDLEAKPDQQVTARRRRADAERNIAAIVDAALTCLGERPQASMTEIARTAGVGRVTLYAHFPSRRALLEAALDHVLAEAGALLESQHLDDQPADEALGALVGSNWQLLDRYRRVFAAAQHELTPQQLRRHHDPALNRIRALVERGQAEGGFRTDLPLDWLVTTVYSLTHAAADDVNAGRLDAADTARILRSTLLAALAPPRRGR
jgi:AcrR family transcriptional regulator